MVNEFGPGGSDRSAGGVDLVLSSGFLAFARHVGFLIAVEELGVPVSAVCGTSSGALVGALWAAGMPARQIGRLLAEGRPVGWLRPEARPWRGALSLDRLLARLSALLPATFEVSPVPLAVGVRLPDGAHGLVYAGPLPAAVVASCAIPGLFAPVDVGGRLLSDGGAVDRLGLDAWRALRGPRPTWVHLVERSHGARAPVDLAGCLVAVSARSRASFLGLRDFEAQAEESRQAAHAAMGAAAVSTGR